MARNTTFTHTSILRRVAAMGRRRRSARLPVVGLCLAAILALPSAAQQFDNFDNSQFEDFELDFDQESVGELTTPSLNDEGLVTSTGPEIVLDRTEGDGDVVLRSFPGAGSDVTSISQPAATTGDRITLRALDKTLGRPTDVDLAIGETVMFGRIAIRAVECRFPSEDPSSDAYGHLEIFDLDGNALFDAWMIASSPALSALEHPRYDVWVLSCYSG